MNPESGFIQGPFREQVQRLARAHPSLSADTIIRMARGEPMLQDTTQAPTSSHEIAAEQQQELQWSA